MLCTIYGGYTLNLYEGGLTVTIPSGNLLYIWYIRLFSSCTFDNYKLQNLLSDLPTAYGGYAGEFWRVAKWRYPEMLMGKPSAIIVGCH